MAVYQLDSVAPQLASGAWVADSAEVIGDVVLGENASVWFQAVLRGDTARIAVGRNTNIQDGAVLHADAGQPTEVGNGVTVGHQAMLHGCTIGDDSLIGIQAVILNGAVIGRNSLVGAGSLVPENRSFPEGSLIVGAPARVVRPLRPEEIERLKHSATHYVEDAARFAKGMVRIG